MELRIVWVLLIIGGMITPVFAVSTYSPSSPGTLYDVIIEQLKEWFKGEPGFRGPQGEMNQTANMTAGPAGGSYDDSLLVYLSGNRTMTGNLSLGMNWVTNVSIPYSENDTATKKYHDANIINNSYALVVDENNRVVYNSSYLTDVVNSSYVTLSNGSYVQINNGSYVLIGNASYILVDGSRPFVGSQSMNNHQITSLITGVSGDTATNKTYVDAVNATGITDHGALTGLTDDDHTQYLLASGGRLVTGNYLRKNVNNGFFQLWGGYDVFESPIFELSGASRAGGVQGAFFVYVPNAAKDALISVFGVNGVTNTPYIDMQTHKISNLLDPTAAQDAATRNYVLYPDYPASAQTNAVCYNSATKAVTYNSGLTTCLASSEKVKIDIQPLTTDYLLKLRELKPSTYISTIDGQKHYGLIGEELEKTFPELVGRNENGTITGIHYEEFTAVLLKGLQEQQVTVEAQQSNIIKLEERIIALEKKAGI